MAIHLKKKIAFRFEVSKTIGYGHFMRCLSIAEKLNKNILSKYTLSSIKIFPLNY